MNSLLALGARALTMVVALVCGVLTTRLILTQAGVEEYALYTLLTTLPSLLAFTDLGSGAVLVNSVATSEDVQHDKTVGDQLTAVGRIIVGFASAIMIVNVLMLVSGGWVALLGDAGQLPAAGIAAFFCLTIFCIGVPVGIWVRIMLGLRRNHVIILVQGMISPVTLLGVWTILHSDTEVAQSLVATASYVGSLVASIVGLALTMRRTGPLIRSSYARIPHLRKYPSVRVMDVGWPMLAQLVTYPIAVSTQRYVIAQQGTPTDVTQYGVAGQVFFAINSLVLAAGLALWPHYAHRRHRGELSSGPFLMSAVFALGVVAATAMIWAAGPWIFGFITGGKVAVQGATILSFGFMITLTAAVYPLGMFIMDKPGIRFQVIPTLSMAFVSIVLAIVLTPLLGVPGPLIGNAVGLLFCQIIPFSIYILRHRERLMNSATSEVTVGSSD